MLTTLISEIGNVITGAGQWIVSALEAVGSALWVAGTESAAGHLTTLGTLVIIPFGVGLVMTAFSILFNQLKLG